MIGARLTRMCEIVRETFSIASDASSELIAVSLSSLNVLPKINLDTRGNTAISRTRYNTEFLFLFSSERARWKKRGVIPRAHLVERLDHAR